MMKKPLPLPHLCFSTTTINSCHSPVVKRVYKLSSAVSVLNRLPLINGTRCFHAQFTIYSDSHTNARPINGWRGGAGVNTPAPD